MRLTRGLLDDVMVGSIEPSYGDGSPNAKKSTVHGLRSTVRTGKTSPVFSSQSERFRNREL